MESGQCHCRPHLIGRQCSEVQPGYFCAPLDYYKYEAEDATGHSPGDSALPVSGPEFQGQGQGQLLPHLPTRATVLGSLFFPGSGCRRIRD